MPEHSLISVWTQLRLGWDPFTLTVVFIGRPLPHPSSFLHCLLRCSWNLYTSPTLISYPNGGKTMGRGKGGDHTPREFLAPSGCMCQCTEAVAQSGVKNRVECKELQRHCSTEKNQRQRARASVQSQDCHPKGWGSRGMPWRTMGVYERQVTSDQNTWQSWMQKAISFPPWPFSVCMRLTFGYQVDGNRGETAWVEIRGGSEVPTQGPHLETREGRVSGRSRERLRGSTGRGKRSDGATEDPLHSCKDDPMFYSAL